MMNWRFNKNLYSLEELGSNISRIIVGLTAVGKEKCRRKECFLMEIRLNIIETITNNCIM